MAEAKGAPPGWRTFLVVLAAQTVSLVGTQLTGFGLGVWVYQQTGSVTLFGLISAAVVVPELLVSPLAGVLVDRWNRRWALVIGHFGAGLCSVGLLLLVWADALAVGWIVLLTGLASVCNAMALPAMQAVTTVFTLAFRHASRLLSANLTNSPR